PPARRRLSVPALPYTTLFRSATAPADIRESYRALLRESRHYGELFDQLQKYSLGRQFDEVVDTFIEIAGNDMSSVGPSTDPRFLDRKSTRLNFSHVKISYAVF